LIGLPADGRADLWSAAVILYELLTGHGPFLAETPASVLHNVLHVDPAPPSSLDSSVPAVFDDLIARALAKKPEDRFQNARDFTNALLAAFVKSKPAPAGGAGCKAERSSPSATPRRDDRGTPAGKRPTGASAPLPLPPETLAEIESSLVRSIGPLAKHLVRQSAMQARSVEEFYAALAENVPEGVERSGFLKHVGRLTAAASTSAPPTPGRPPEAAAAKPVVVFDPATLAAAEKRLAQYVGPLAKVLIKRAANDSGDIGELYHKLAEHIDSEPERREFLKGCV